MSLLPRPYWVLLVAALLAGAGGLAAEGWAKGKSDTEPQLTKADSIAKSVAKLRGLRIKKKIARGVMSKAQIRARIVELVDMEYTKEQIDAESLSMKRFGLLGANEDFMKILIDLLEDQVAGFYDQHQKKLFIAGWTHVGGDAVMAHEIDHALQDQHFDLTSFMKPNLTNGDANLGRQALVEGDGMAIMLEFQMASMNQAPPWGNPTILSLLKKGMDTGSSIKGVPLAMSEALVFPYIAGLDFIVHFRKKHSWSTIDKMYAKPPLSSEQILHPEKYESYERPHEVAVAGLTGGSAREQAVNNVYGEKGMEIFLRANGVSREKAIGAAEGWGGDRMAVFVPKGHKGSNPVGTTGVLLTSWDSKEEADEFFETLRSAMPTLCGGTAQNRKSQDMVVFSMKEGGLAWLQQKGDSVLLLLRVDEADIATLAMEVWKSWTVTKPADTVP